MSRLPPLQAFEAFVLAARLHSFQAAAERMALSTSAFSRRIQQIEDSVGVRLFERGSSGVRLTCQGAQYLAEIDPALNAIRRATSALRSTRSDEVLRLAASYSFASNWLARRLPSARAAIGVEIELTQTRDLQLLSSGAVDCAIWGGLDDFASSEKLFAAEAVAVTAAGQGGSAGDAQSIAAFAGRRLLSVQTPGQLWDRWLEAAGYQGRAPRTTQFDTLQHVYDAAEAGLGVALAIPLVFEPHLQSGRLRACNATRVALSTGYRIYYSSPAAASRRCVVRFGAWLRDEVTSSQLRFNAWWDNQCAHLSRSPGARRAAVLHSRDGNQPGN